MKKKIAIVSALLVATSLFGASAAQAGTFAATANKAVGLNPVGDTVIVTLTDVPADQGVYVRLCAGTMAEVATGRPTNCFGQGNWVSTNAAALGQGATDATKPVELAVMAKFTSGTTAIDCTIQACGIHIRRDHMGGATDYSLDRFIPVTFAAAAPVAVTSASLKAGKVSFEVVGQIGKSLVFKYGTKTVTKKAISDDYKVSFTVASATKSIAVSVKAGTKTLLAKTIK